MSERYLKRLCLSLLGVMGFSMAGWAFPAPAPEFDYNTGDGWIDFETPDTVWTGQSVDFAVSNPRVADYENAFFLWTFNLSDGSLVPGAATPPDTAVSSFDDADGIQRVDTVSTVYNLPGTYDIRLLVAPLSVDPNQTLADNIITVFDSIPANVGVTAVLGPTPSGDCGFGTEEAISVRILNYGYEDQGGFPVTYMITGPDNSVQMVTETFAGIVAPLASAEFTFSQTADMSSAGDYTIVVYTDLMGDPIASGFGGADTVSTVITNIVVNAIPYVENFENGSNGWFAEGGLWELGEPDGDVLDEAASGSNAWGTNLDGDYPINAEAALISPCFNFSNNMGPTIEFSLNLETETNFDFLTFEFDTTGEGNWEAFDEDDYLETGGFEADAFTGGTGGEYVRIRLAPRGLGGAPEVRFRFFFESDFSVVAEGVLVDSFAIDVLPDNEVGITELIAPLSACDLSDDVSIEVVVENFGVMSQDSVVLFYTFGGDTTRLSTQFSDGLMGGMSDTITISGLDLSADSAYMLTVFIDVLGDETAENDTLRATISNLVTIDGSSAYFEGFEDGMGGWYTDTPDLWEVGVPDNSEIDTAGQGVNAWVTDLDGDYPNDINASLLSPCFDFSGNDLPALAFQANLAIASGFDGAVLEYSIAGGPWIPVGSAEEDGAGFAEQEGEIAPFYNNTSNSGPVPAPKWSVGRNGWWNYQIILPQLGGLPQVNFRFRLGSNETNVDEGIAIDSFALVTIPDVALALEAEYPSPYVITPRRHVQPIDFTATLINNGAQALSGAGFYVDVIDEAGNVVFTDTSATVSIPSLSQNGRTTLSILDAYTPDAIGDYTIVYTAFSAADGDEPDDNEASFEFEVSEATYAQEDGDIDLAFPFTFTLGYGLIYEFMVLDTLTSVDVFLDAPTANATLRVDLYPTRNGVPLLGAPAIGSSGVINVGGVGSGVFSVPVDSLVVQPGTYLVSVTQLSGSIRMAATREFFTPGFAFLTEDLVTWDPLEESRFTIGGNPIEAKYFIRPQLVNPFRLPFSLVLDDASAGPYTLIPLRQVDSLDFSVTLFNDGTQVLDDVAFYVDVTDEEGNLVFSDTSATTSIPPSTGAELDMSTIYVPDTTGVYTVEYFAFSSSLDDPIDDNSATTTFEVTETLYAREIGENNSLIAYDAADFRQGQIFKMVQLDTLTGVEIALGVSNAAGPPTGTLVVELFPAQDGEPVEGEDPVVSSDTIDVTGIAELTFTVPFDSVEVEPGEYLFVVRQLSGIINLLLTINNYEPGVFLTDNLTGDGSGNYNGWIPTDLLFGTAGFTYHIRPEFINPIALPDFSLELEVESASYGGYTMVPFRHVAPLDLSVTLRNLGAEALENVGYYVDVLDEDDNVVFSDTSNRVTVGSRQERQASLFTTYTPDTTGEYTVNFVAFTSSDEELPDDNIATYTFEVSDSSYRRDNSNYAFVYGGGALPADTELRFGLMYELNAADTLTAVDIAVNVPGANASLKIDVFPYVDGAPATGVAPIASSDTLDVSQVSANFQFFTAVFDSVAMDPGRYVFAVHQLGDEIRLLATADVYTPNTAFFSSDLTEAWSTLARTPVIRPMFVSPFTTGTTVSANNPFSRAVKLYPNPTQGRLNIVIDRRTLDPAEVRVYNVLGKEVAVVRDQGALSSGMMQIDLSREPAGTYLVQVVTDSQVVIKKVILTR
ncbi:MAG: T9SS type A sorting domain-containing protein [Catalinimonas sp.]